LTRQQDHFEFGWYIPTGGDGWRIGTKAERESTTAYMVEVAQAVEEAGFTFALIPTGYSFIDPLIVAATVASHTSKLHYLVALRPGLIAPIMAARMTASLDALSQGRTRLNIVTGNGYDLKEFGDPLADRHDERYARTKEFVNILRGVWSGNKGPGFSEFVNTAVEESEKFRYQGEHYQIDGASSYPETVQKPHPPIYFGGSSVIGKRIAAETSDVFMMLAEPVAAVKEQIDELEGYLSELREQGIDRSLSYGIRGQVLVRDTEEEAIAAAYSIISESNEESREDSMNRLSKTDAVLQTRMNQLRDEHKANNYWVGPNMWTGLSTLRGGGGILFVGTAEQVAERLLSYADIGITKFILSGYPHLEEAKIFGEKVLPLIKERLAQRAEVVTK